ncbi:MAG: type I phosphomannose isomerase catalytic subunit [Candidatus Brocadiales bacterium]
MVLYPLKFRSIYKKKIWAGHRLMTLFGRDISVNERVGESWEIADHGADTTVIKNGPLAGEKLHDIVAKNGIELLGKKWVEARTNPSLRSRAGLFVHAASAFPLLVKLIDTREMLSVQVHPDDAYAQKHEGQSEQGKMEAWYIMHAEPGARLVHGVIPGTTVEGLKELLTAGRLEECLNFVTAKVGDVVFIPPGTVHAIGAGILLLEVSQNSDATYRLFDWNRLGEDGEPRPLHIDKALDVIQVQSAGCGMRNNSELLLECPKFSLELLEFEKYIEEQNNTDNFHILTVIKGEGRLQLGEGKDFVSFSEGESILIPASLKSYEILPSNMCKVIKTSVP